MSKIQEGLSGFRVTASQVQLGPPTAGQLQTGTWHQPQGGAPQSKPHSPHSECGARRPPCMPQAPGAGEARLASTTQKLDGLDTTPPSTSPGEASSSRSRRHRGHQHQHLSHRSSRLQTADSTQEAERLLSEVSRVIPRTSPTAFRVALDNRPLPVTHSLPCHCPAIVLCCVASRIASHRIALLLPKFTNFVSQA